MPEVHSEPSQSLNMELLLLKQFMAENILFVNAWMQSYDQFWETTTLDR